MKMIFYNKKTLINFSVFFIGKEDKQWHLILETIDEEK